MRRFTRDVTRCRQCPAWRWSATSVWHHGDATSIARCELTGTTAQEEPTGVMESCPLPGAEAEEPERGWLAERMANGQVEYLAVGPG